MGVKVHFSWELKAALLDRFSERLVEYCDVSSGDDVPAGVNVLIKGSLESGELDGLMDLRAVVIPYAGLARGTREVLLKYPSLEVYNLHHNAASTAEMAIGLMIAVAKRLCAFDSAMRMGRWSLSGVDLSHTSLAGKRVVVLGYGEIGRRVVNVCLAFGMRVSVLRRRGAGELPYGVMALDEVSWREALRGADFLQICLPLTEKTARIVGEGELALLPKHAVVVNTARGPLVDERALFEALKGGRIGGAGLDVWWKYPGNRERAWLRFPSSFKFHKLKNVVMVPHRGGDLGDKALEGKRVDALADLVNALLRGDEGPNRVDVGEGY